MGHRMRTATRGAVAVGALAALVVGASALFAQEGATLGRLTMEEGQLAWGEIRLGMTIPQLERRVGTTIAIKKGKESCPVWEATAEYKGLSLVLGFPSPKPSAKLDYVYVRFEEALIQYSGSDLQAVLKKQFPDAQWIPPAEPAGLAESDDLEPDYAISSGKEPQVVRLFPREAMILAKRSCLG